MSQNPSVSVSPNKTRILGQRNLWLARGLFMALALIALTSFLQIPDFMQAGRVMDVVWMSREDGQKVVTDVMQPAVEKGVLIGDIVINHEDSHGLINTLVSIYFRTGEDTARPVTFIRQSIDRVVYGLVRLGVPLSTAFTFYLVIVLGWSLIVGLVSALIFWKRSDDWLALLIAWLFLPLMSPQVWPLFNFYHYIYVPVWGLLLTVVVLTFPLGRFQPRWTLALPILVGVILTYQQLTLLGWLPFYQNLYFLMGPAITAIALVCVPILSRRYHHLFTPTERQQSKWIFLSLTCLPLVGLFGLPISLLMRAGQPDLATYYGIFDFVISHVLTTLIPIGFALALFRSRLWDVDLVINQALVYSGLTAILGFSGVVIVSLLTFGLKQFFNGQSPLLTVLITALPLTAAFKPVQNRLQRLVDHYLKPEELDLPAFVELTPEARTALTFAKLGQALVTQVMAQLKVASAEVYWHSPAPPPVLELTTLPLTASQREQLTSGKPVAPSSEAGSALLVPLVVKRGRQTDFLGVLALGTRINGQGYSSHLLDSLQQLGAEAGKSLYLAQLHDAQMTQRISAALKPMADQH